MDMSSNVYSILFLWNEILKADILIVTVLSEQMVAIN